MTSTTTDYSSYGRCFINGAFVDKTDKTFALSFPATGKVVAANVQEAGARGGSAAAYTRSFKVAVCVRVCVCVPRLTSDDNCLLCNHHLRGRCRCRCCKGRLPRMGT